MRAADTNVLVRYLTNDNPGQAALARAEIDKGDMFVPRTVLLETEWVLRAVYELPALRIAAALRAFAGLPGIVLDDAPLVAVALDWAESGMDFADALHLAASRGCDGFLTFDKRLARASRRAWAAANVILLQAAV